MKRKSDPKLEYLRQKQAKQARRASKVNWDADIYPLADRHNTAQSGQHANRRPKSSREVGDIRTVFDLEYVAFKGGEGGNGWTVKSTLN